ncbi:hypothetical protein [Flavicella marina]|uniref:hypothetical protein n=1 Tax=Flavicella marina TaxID=1475951 RepID=UPI00126460EA|nr:hypothetical protein [Flavicella marina]
MKIVCEVEMIDSPHLYHLYSGFLTLETMGIIELKLKTPGNDGNVYKPILHVKINNSITVVYDLLDGFNWISGTIEENLKFFQEEYKNVDYYFKRSFNNKLLDYKAKTTKILALGLFYRIEKPDFLKNKYKVRAKEIMRGFNLFTVEKNQFCAPPILSDLNSMLYTRLWDPSDVEAQHLKEERELININRIESILACKKEFKDRFVGGLSNTPYAQKKAKSLVLDGNITNRKNYLTTLKSTAISIVNLGLHNSNGGRFAESVAASRAIVTEPLVYQATGDFLENKNYLTFTDKEMLLSQVESLLSSPKKVKTMMEYNYKYYNNYLRPENLVLNSLIEVLK